MEASTTYEGLGSNNLIDRYLNTSFLENVFYLAQKTGAKKVLDAGCGEGFVIERLKKELPAEFQGLDIEEKTLEIAKSKNPLVTFKCASVYKLPFEDKSFDLIILSGVLEYLKDPEQALYEINRASGKYVLISVPHEPVWRVGNIARFKHLRNLGSDPGHVNHWTRRAFIGLISGYFDVKEIKSPFPRTIALCRKKEVN